MYKNASWINGQIETEPAVDGVKLMPVAQIKYKHLQRVYTSWINWRNIASYGWNKPMYVAKIEHKHLQWVDI